MAVPSREITLIPDRSKPGARSAPFEGRSDARDSFLGSKAFYRGCPISRAARGGRDVPGHYKRDVRGLRQAAAIDGNNLDNKLVGTNGADIIRGYGGNDKINGRGGADTLRGGLGNDTLRGAAGVDVIYGGRGGDHVLAEEDDGVNDTVYAGSGNDVIEADGDEGVDTVSCGDGRDQVS